MTFDDDEPFPPFDPNDPIDIIAESSRVAVGRLLTGHLESDDSAEHARAVLTGALVAVLGVSMHISDPDDHHQLVQNVSDTLPAMANYVRDMMGLPPLVQH